MTDRTEPAAAPGAGAGASAGAGARKGGLPVIPFADAAAWEAWLEANHATSMGLWLQLAKKGSGIASVTYAEALDVALCFGWIDGLKGALDERYWLQRFTRRGQGQPLVADQPGARPRLAARGPHAAAGPDPDGAGPGGRALGGRLRLAAARHRAGRSPGGARPEPGGEGLLRVSAGQNRFAILYRLHDAKRPETRARRLAQFVEMLNEQRKPYP